MGRSKTNRQTVVKPLGYMSTPNPYGQFPAGALREAKNCLMRRPGEVMSCPSSANYTQFHNSGYVIRNITPLNSGHMMLLSQDTGADSWLIDECQVGGAVNTAAFPLGMNTTGLFSASRVTSTRSRDRALFNTKTNGVLALDSMTPSSLAQRTLRRSGLPQPIFGISSINTTTGSAIPIDVMVGYRALITRESADGYILKGVPSVPIKYKPTVAGPTSITFYASFFAGIVQAGDYVELYRTDGLSTTSINADPGGTYKLIYRVQLTAADITAGTINITDNQVLIAPYYSTYGRELYTNPYQEGSTGANRQADICQAMATWKGFTFYGNLTERSQFTVSVPGGFNDSVLMPSGNARRATGVGVRTLTGTVSSGSPNVTGISTADMVGIVPGQLIFASGAFAFGTKVLSVAATSLVATAAATSSPGGPGNVTCIDVLNVDGIDYMVNGTLPLVSTVSGYEVTVNQSISANTGADAAGLTVTYETFVPVIDTHSFKATNGQNYSPPLPIPSATALTVSSVTTSNLLRWSKDSEPEHVPSVNETLVGSGQIIALVPTKDALWIACSDGVYRLSGDGGAWRIDIVAPGLVLCSPRCMVNMRETIFAYTNYGFGAITDSGFVPISASRARSQFPGPPFSEAADLLLGRNDVEGEVLVSMTASGTTAVIYVWNTLTQAFTYLNSPSQHFAQVTAFAWLENPASGNQCTIFGVAETSQAPGFFTWNSASVQLDMLATYYPIYGDDPVSPKQWIDITYVFLEESTGYTLTGTIYLPASTVSFASGVIAQSNDADAAVTLGIPRAYAINPSIKPGFTVTGITVNRIVLTGISLRYAELSQQRNVRQ